MDYRKNHQFKFKQTNIEIKRFYSVALTKATVVLRTDREVCKLDLWWVTGFVDGEGCFHCSITENKNSNLGWYVRLYFQITLHQRDKTLLEGIKNSLGVGQIYKAGPTSLNFIVNQKKGLKKFKIIFRNILS